MYKRNKSTRRSKSSKGSKCSKGSKGSKRTSKRHTRKNNRRHTRYTSKGGNYTQQTEMTLEGVPLEKDAVVTVDGVGSMSIQQFKDYVNNKDLHPRS
jgi:hypothetical protein